MRVLLPVDGSPCSNRAVRYAIRHLQAFGTRPAVVLVHVDSPMIERASRYVAAEDLARFHARNAAAATRAAKRLLAKAGVTCRERHLVGDAGECIARTAKEERCELIVMGSHGRGALKSLLLGSIVTRTIALTKVPVLVVR